MTHWSLALVLFLSIGVIEGHFFWAETDEDADSVAVTFSESAGVPDKVIAMMEGRVTSVTFKSISKAAEIALELNEEKTVLEGDLPHDYIDDGPVLVSGYLDFGPFMTFADLEYSFEAQVYRSKDDFDSFFRPLLKKADTPSIALRNCGGKKDGKSMSYQFGVGGFPEGPLDVCLYRKGGQKIGCGEWNKQQLEEELVINGVSAESFSSGRKLIQDRNPIPVDEPPPSEDTEASYVLYAMANTTITDEASGNTSIAFASTSVYFKGPCKD